MIRRRVSDYAPVPPAGPGAVALLWLSRAPTAPCPGLQPVAAGAVLNLVRVLRAVVVAGGLAAFVAYMRRRDVSG